MRAYSLSQALASIREDLDSSAFEDALATLKRVMSVAPLHGEAQFLLGAYFWRRGQTDRAHTAMTWAALCEPNAREAWENLALIGSARNSTDRAVLNRRRAVMVGADSAMLADKIFDIKKPDSLRAALCLDPRDAKVASLLALAEAEEEALDSASWGTARAEVLAVWAGSAALLGQLCLASGRRLQARGRFKCAIPSLRRAVVLDPDGSEGIFDLGRSLFESGAVAEAGRMVPRTAVIKPMAPGFVYRHTRRLASRHPGDVSSSPAYCYRELDAGSAVRIEPVGQAGPRIEYKVPATFLARADDAQLLAGHHSVILPGGEVLIEGLTYRQKRRRWDGPCYAYVAEDGGILAALPNPEPRIDEEAILLGCGANYYHNVVDWLSRVPTILDQPALDGLPILVSREIPGSVVEILEMLGVARERLRMLPAGLFPVRRLWLPSLAHGRLGCVSPRYMEFLEKRLFGRFRDRRARGRRRLFLSRRGDRHRHIVNHDALDALLKKHGFESVSLEMLSAEDQFRLVADAEAVMAPFGAGLTNLVACPETTTVIELTHEQAVRPLFPILAGLRRQPFYRVTGRTLRSPGARLPLHANFTIPVDQVEAVIEQALGGG